jgi:hypothetical protein
MNRTLKSAALALTLSLVGGVALAADQMACCCKDRTEKMACCDKMNDKAAPAQPNAPAQPDHQH